MCGPLSQPGSKRQHAPPSMRIRMPPCRLQPGPGKKDTRDKRNPPCCESPIEGAARSKPARVPSSSAEDNGADRCWRKTTGRGRVEGHERLRVCAQITRRKKRGRSEEPPFRSGVFSRLVYGQETQKGTQRRKRGNIRFLNASGQKR